MHTLRFMHKFHKISIEANLCCSLDAYLIVIMINHFHFVYFRDQCEMLSKFCEIIHFKVINFCMSTYDFDVFIIFVMFSVTNKKIHGNVDIMSCLG